MNTELVKAFLSYFGKNKILCYNRDINAKSSMINTSLDEIVSMNKAGRDVYFYVNNGGTKKNEMQPVACYVDLDAGRDSNKKYKSFQEVRKLKKKMLEKIRDFVRPTFIVETRNGYQVYWVLSDKKVDINNWNAVQSKLCNYFKDVGSDSICSKINQIYRIPTSIWWKKWEGKPKFYTRFIRADTLTPFDDEDKDDLRYISFRTRFDGLKDLLKDIPAKKHTNAYSDFANKLNANYKEEAPIYYGDKLIKSDATEQQENTQLLLDIKNFLLECSTTLFYAGKKYSATQARELAEKLSRDYCV